MSESREPPVDNIVLLIVDALRVDRVGAYSGEDRSLTPNIDALARDGEVFDRCFACVNATDSSMTTIMTGLYPTRHGVINHGKNITDQERRFVSATTPIPELLSESHRSIGVDMLGRWHKRGFDEYFMDRSEGLIRAPDDQPGLRARVTRSMYRSIPTAPVLSFAKSVLDVTPEPIPSVAESLYTDHLSSTNPYSTVNKFLTGNERYLDAIWVRDRMEHAITQEPRPWFLLGHFWDTHLPYNVKPDYLEAMSDRTDSTDDRSITSLVDPISGSSWAHTLRRISAENGWSTSGDLLRAYDASVRLVDDAIGAIVNSLKSNDLYEETAIIVTADHGESLLEHDILFDHHGLYDSTIHVPLIVNAPGFDGHEPGFVQHTDLAPTILDLVGHLTEPDRFDGHSLVEGPEPRRVREWVVAEEGNAARKRAIRTDSHKYIRRLDNRRACRYCDVEHADPRELYQLDSDPEETTNLMDERPAVVEQLEDDMAGFIDAIPRPGEGPVRFDEDEEVLRRLEHMGYK